MNESKFRKLQVWQRSRELAREIYGETNAFPRSEMFGLTQQLRRAAISVLSNIAEGQGRRTSAEGRMFAVHARGSLLEIEAQFVIASDLGYISIERADRIIAIAVEVARMLNGLIRKYDEQCR